MAGGEPRLGITWMNMHTQNATNRRRKQEHERDLHAYNPGARRPKFARYHSLAPIAGKKSRLMDCDEDDSSAGPPPAERGGCKEILSCFCTYRSVCIKN